MQLKLYLKHIRRLNILNHVLILFFLIKKQVPKEFKNEKEIRQICFKTVIRFKMFIRQSDIFHYKNNNSSSTERHAINVA